MNVHKLLMRKKGEKYSDLLSEEDSLWINCSSSCQLHYVLTFNFNKNFVGLLVSFIWRTKHYQFHRGHFPHQTLMKRGTAAFFDHSCGTSSDSSCSLQSLILLLALILSPFLYPPPRFLLFHCICQAATQDISAKYRIWPRTVINWCIPAVGKRVSQILRNRQGGK